MMEQICPRISSASAMWTGTDGRSWLFPMLPLLWRVEALGAVREEFVEFPAVTFYDNGIVRADWSHNPSTVTDSEFWPFTLYVYGEDEDSYVEIGSVYEGNEKGVYYQTLAGEDELEINETVLEDWLSFCIQDSKELSIPMESLTEEHIKALR